MSHEIRTPMNAIFGYSQILQRDAGLSAEQQRGIDSIMRSGTHLLEVGCSNVQGCRIEHHQLAKPAQRYRLRMRP